LREWGTLRDTIRFEIGPHFLSEEGGSYKQGGSIYVRCIFLNVSSKTQTILLSDHDDYAGTRPFPFGLLARVWNPSGEVITTNEFDAEGWWSSEYGSSAIFFEKPGDRILLKPGAKVVRIVPLDLLLQGCKTIPHGLSAGQYSVQLSIGKLISNKIEIKIRG
jgi:hypothetical protein